MEILVRYARKTSSNLISLLLIKITSSIFQEMFIKASSFLFSKYLNFELKMSRLSDPSPNEFNGVYNLQYITGVLYFYIPCFKHFNTLFYTFTKNSTNLKAFGSWPRSTFGFVFGCAEGGSSGSVKTIGSWPRSREGIKPGTNARDPEPKSGTKFCQQNIAIKHACMTCIGIGLKFGSNVDYRLFFEMHMIIFLHLPYFYYMQVKYRTMSWNTDPEPTFSVLTMSRNFVFYFKHIDL